MEKCSKCLTESGFLVRYTNIEENWALCYLCNSTYDDRIGLLREFMKEDFGNFPLNKVSRGMIMGRLNRACGKGPWLSPKEQKE